MAAGIYFYGHQVSCVWRLAHSTLVSKRGFFSAREKIQQRDEESDELKDFQNQELGKVKHMLIIAQNQVSRERNVFLIATL